MSKFWTTMAVYTGAPAKRNLFSGEEVQHTLHVATQHKSYEEAAAYIPKEPSTFGHTDVSVSLVGPL